MRSEYRAAADAASEAMQKAKTCAEYSAAAILCRAAARLGRPHERSSWIGAENQCLNTARWRAERGLP